MSIIMSMIFIFMIYFVFIKQIIFTNSARVEALTKGFFESLITKCIVTNSDIFSQISISAAYQNSRYKRHVHTI